MSDERLSRPGGPRRTLIPIGEHTASARSAIAAWSRLDAELARIGVGAHRRRLLGAAILQAVVIAVLQVRRAPSGSKG